MSPHQHFSSNFSSCYAKEPLNRTTLWKYVAQKTISNFRIYYYPWINVLKLCLNKSKEEPWTSVLSRVNRCYSCMPWNKEMNKTYVHQYKYTSMLYLLSLTPPTSGKWIQTCHLQQKITLNLALVTTNMHHWTQSLTVLISFDDKSNKYISNGRWVLWHCFFSLLVLRHQFSCFDVCSSIHI